MKKIPITLSLLIAVLAGVAGYLYVSGIDPANWFGRHNGKTAPVSITDTTKNYSYVQRLQLERPDEPFPHTDAERQEWVNSDNRTYVPPEISYVRVEYLASKVDKPYPKIFFADLNFPTDIWMLENVAVVKPATISSVLSSADALACEPNSAVLGKWTDQMEILIRPANKPLKRCLLSVKSGCRYLMRLHFLTSELKGNKDEYLLPEIEHRLDCPTLLWPWARN